MMITQRNGLERRSIATPLISSLFDDNSLARWFHLRVQTLGFRKDVHHEDLSSVDLRENLQLLASETFCLMVDDDRHSRPH